MFKLKRKVLCIQPYVKENVLVKKNIVCKHVEYIAGYIIVTQQESCFVPSAV